MHGSLLNHMIIITKVGVSYIDHMNDDAPEDDSFLANVTRLSPPPVFERAWEWGYVITYPSGFGYLCENETGY